MEQQESGSLEASRFLELLTRFWELLTRFWELLAMFWELLAMFWKLLAKTSYSKTDQAERACSRSDLCRHDHNHSICRVAILTFKRVV